MSEKVKLSPSRLSTLFNCSFEYWLKYVRKIPDVGNKGSSRGTCVHNCLELLIRADRRPLVEKILAAKDPWIIPSVKRLVKIYHKKEKILDDSDFEMIRNYILKALGQNFFEDGSSELRIEHYFSITTDKFSLQGFLDKVAFYGDRIKIRDYKTSKKKFSAADLKFNLQNYFYTFAISKEFPGVPIDFEFLFLGFKNPLVKAPSISPEEYAGFEEWLGQVTDYITDFDYSKAIQNPGRFNPKVKFWKCGPPMGAKNSLGEPAWYCPMKYPFTYFSLCEGEKIIQTSRDKNELIKIQKEGQVITQREYEGCFFHKELWENKDGK